MANLQGIEKLSDTLWELPLGYRDGMRVPARIYATEKLVREMDEAVLEQVSNVATLPGIVEAALCMPDGHYGYGFPIGGVAAMDVDAGGVISPGGIGFDINCGMRLVVTNLTRAEVEPHLEALVDRLFEQVPAGVGSKGFVRLSKAEFRRVVEQGARWCIANGLGWDEDLELTEESGCIDGADAGAISERAVERGFNQIGTLGSGNHYLEIQTAPPADILDQDLAQAFGITRPDQVVIMFHCGSMRGLGEEAGGAYKPIDEVVDACTRAGISRPVARLLPMGNVKG